VYPISLGRVDPSTLSHGSSTNLCSGSTPYPPPSVLYCALQATPPSPATACSPRLEPAPVYRPLPYLSPNAPRSGIHALPPLHRYSTGHASLAGDLMVSATRTRAGLPKLHPSRIYLLTPPLRYPRPTPPQMVLCRSRLTRRRPYGLSGPTPRRSTKAGRPRMLNQRLLRRHTYSPTSVLCFAGHGLTLTRGYKISMYIYIYIGIYVGIYIGVYLGIYIYV